ncbi:MAG TPA: GvpL/GvpF family gas vesicle protein [Acidimicrobiales bacterium]|nr:GvpL/GvpF family gas vesicle protein [Acidimicrobiales bacterium]
MSALDDTLRNIAADQWPAVVAEATAAARRQAVEVLTARLTELLLAGGEDSHRYSTATVSLASPGETDPPPSSAAGTGWYLYGLTMPHVARAVTGRPGVGDSALQTVPIGRIAAVVSPVASDRSWAAGADIDLDALTPRIAEHQRVLEDILELGPVVPMRFGIMYPELSALVSAVEADTEHLNAELCRLDGLVEWGLAIEWSGHRPALPLGEGPRTGRQYLSDRQQDRCQAERAEHDASLAAEAVHRSLLAIATDAVVHPARRTGEDGRPTLLRASYLVDRAAGGALRQAAGRALAAAPSPLGLTGELTGPWPAYHFVSMPLEQAG